MDTTLTLLLPTSLVAMVMVGVQVVRCVRLKIKATSTGDDVIATPSHVAGSVALQLYHVVQTMAYAVMAILIMRLKLFLTPQLSVLCGLLPGLLRASKVGGAGEGGVSLCVPSRSPGWEAGIWQW